MAKLPHYCEPRFMDRWCIEMRYSDGASIDHAAVDRWRSDAEAAVADL